MHGFALAENIDFISKKLDKWRHPEAWQDGVREIQSARLSRLRVYDSDSENECRDESGLKHACFLAKFLNEPDLSLRVADVNWRKAYEAIYGEVSVRAFACRILLT